MKTLTDIANKHGTDKGTVVGGRHGYTEIYSRLFEPFREESFAIAEVGLSIGGPEVGFSPDRQVITVPSVEMWLEYFPNAQLTGIDISDCSSFTRNRFDFIRVDCSDRGAVRNAATTINPRVVVDDGSHASYHQQVTFLELFPRLSSGGIYIIEDLDWQPEPYESDLPQTAKTASLFSWLQSTSRDDWPSLIGHQDWAPVLDEIEKIVVYRVSELDSLSGVIRQKPRPKWKELVRSMRRKPRKAKADPIKLAVIHKR